MIKIPPRNSGSELGKPCDNRGVSLPWPFIKGHGWSKLFRISEQVATSANDGGESTRNAAVSTVSTGHDKSTNQEQQLLCHSRIKTIQGIDELLTWGIGLFE